MLATATELQREAEEYELIIADFLRHHALADAARVNYQDLLRTFSLGADERVSARLAEAEQSLLDFCQAPNEASRLALEQSTRALQDIDLDSERLNELDLQVAMLVKHIAATQPQQH